MSATSTVELESLSIPAGNEGAATSEWIQKMVLDSVVQSQQQQIQQLQQQVHTLTEQTTKLHQPPCELLYYHHITTTTITYTTTISSQRLYNRVSLK